MIKFPKKLLEPIRKYLMREEKKTKKTLEELKKEDPFSDPEHANDNAASDTEASEQSSHQRIESLQREVRARLAAIGKALSRLKKGKYGTCEKCGKMISTDRLGIMPTATVCVECERKKEK